MSALNIRKGATSHSAYELRDPNAEVIEVHTLAVVVDNEAGVLARVIGLFAGRGYNIESLTVAEVDHKGHLSRITVVTSGTPQVIDQIKAQLGRLVPVHEVHDLTVEGPSVQRELALFKVAGKGEARVEALRLADIFRAIGGRFDAGKLRLRDHRHRREDRRFRRPDASARPARNRPHRRRRPVARPLSRRPAESPEAAAGGLPGWPAGRNRRARSRRCRPRSADGPVVRMAP